MYKRIIAGVLSTLICASAIPSRNVLTTSWAAQEDTEQSVTAENEAASDVAEEKSDDTLGTTNAQIILSVPDDSEIYESVELGENIRADIYSNGLLRIHGHGDMNNFTKNPFVNAASVTQVLFEDTDAENGLVITNIGDYLFSGMSQLSSAAYGDITNTAAGIFVLPDGVKHIGSSAFSDCSAISEFRIGENVESFGDCVFKDCTGLKKMKFPSLAEDLGSNTLIGCTSIKELTLPYASTRRDLALAGSSNDWNSSISDMFIYSWNNHENINLDFSDYALEKVTVTGGEIIPACAFSNMPTLKEVDFSGTEIQDIREKAFQNCTSLATVKLPDTVTSYGNYSFYNTPITSLNPKSVITSIGEHAFAECSKLKSITIPDTCETIGFRAFRNCKALTKMTVPESVSTIEASAFEGCTSIKELTLPYASTRRDLALAISSTDWNSSISDLFIYSWNNLENINLDFSDYALEKVTVTGGEIIPACAFSNMPTLKEVDFSGTEIQDIREKAFQNCTSLATVKLPDTVTSYGNYSFYNTPITSLNPKSVITSIGEHAFAECSKLKSITIPDTCETIGFRAFRNCKSLTEMTVPESVSTIEISAFEGCTSIKELTLPYAGTRRDLTLYGSITDWNSSISDMFIYSWNNRENINLDYSDYALEKVTVTGGDIIPAYAFSGMPSLREIDIYNSETSSLNEYSFNGCKGLTAVSLPTSVDEINDNTFANFDADVYIYNPDCLISSNAFNKNYSGTIYCYKDSTAETFAIDKGFDYEIIENEIVIGPKNISLNVGDKYTIRSDYRSLEFSSSDPTVASVDKNGVISGKKEGKASIKVNAGKNGTCTMNVNVRTTTTTTTTTTAAATTTTTTAANTTTSSTSSAQTSTRSDTTASTTSTRTETTTTKPTTTTTTSGTTTTTATATSTSSATTSKTTSSSTSETTTTTTGTTTTQKITMTKIAPSSTTAKTTTSSSGTTTSATTTEPVRLNIDGELKITPMTPEDIKAAGIDISGEENFNSFKYTIEADFKASGVVIEKTVVNNNKQPVYEKTTLQFRGSGEGMDIKGADFDIPKGKPVYIPEMNAYVVHTETVEEEMYMLIYGKCKWLKEFYDVQLIVINKDSNTLKDCTSTLAVPEGLTLVKGDLTQDMGDLEPNQIKTADWYLRGDSEGDYNLTALLTGSNNGKEFEYEFKSKETLHVYANSALKMSIKLPRYSFYNEYYPITIGLTNKSDKTIYDLENEISKVMQVSKATLRHYENNNLVFADTKTETLINDNNVSKIHVDEIAPGETVEIELQIKDLWKSVWEKYLDAERFDANTQRLMELLSRKPEMNDMYWFHTIYESIFSELPVAHILEDVKVAFPGSDPIEYEVIVDETKPEGFGAVGIVYNYASNNKIREIFYGPKEPKNAFEAFRNDYIYNMDTRRTRDNVDDFKAYLDQKLSMNRTEAVIDILKDMFFVVTPNGKSVKVKYREIPVSGSSASKLSRNGFNMLKKASSDAFEFTELYGTQPDADGYITVTEETAFMLKANAEGRDAEIIIEYSDGTSETIKVHSVKEHECSSSGGYILVDAPANGQPGLAVQTCDSCGAVLDTVSINKNAIAMLSDKSTYADIRVAVEEAVKAGEHTELSLFGNINVISDIIIPDYVDVLIAPDTNINVNDNCKLIAKGKVTDFSGHNYDLSGNAPAATTTAVTETTAVITETTAEVIVSSSDSTSSAEETTTTTTTVSESSDTTSTTTTTSEKTEEEKSNASISQWVECVSNDYESKNGTAPDDAETKKNTDGTYSIILKDENGQVLDTYVIDPETGKGTNSGGETVELPQTGNNSLTNALTAFLALMMTGFGLVAIKMSGIFSRRKKEDE